MNESTGRMPLPHSGHMTPIPTAHRRATTRLRSLPPIGGPQHRRLGALRTTIHGRQGTSGLSHHDVPMLHPPAPPIRLTPLLACDETTDMEILWHIARHAPELRRWLIANPKADAALMEYVAQVGGPGVARGFEVLFESMG